MSVSVRDIRDVPPQFTTAGVAGIRCGVSPDRLEARQVVAAQCAYCTISVDPPRGRMSDLPQLPVDAWEDHVFRKSRAPRSLTKHGVTGNCRSAVAGMQLVADSSPFRAARTGNFTGCVSR